MNQMPPQLGCPMLYRQQKGSADVTPVTQSVERPTMCAQFQ